MTTDRDQSIERLLRRTRAAEPHRPDACPDAETLAALADGALTAAARHEIEGHVADCHRCQALTAAMVRADSSTGGIPGEAAVRWWSGGAVKWLVPAAAAATALAVWVAIPAQRAQIAEEQPIADVPTAPSPPAASPPAEAPADASVPSSRDASGPAAASAERSAVLNRRSAQEARERAAARNESTADQQGVSQPQSVAGQRGGALNETVRLPEAPAAETVAQARSLSASAVDVVSPDPQRRWRIGPGASVQHSVDGGGTWTRQETGTGVELTSGGAPTPDVCWIVGRAGTVVRTTDGGRRWERVAFPEAIDLTAVTASSALAATVDAADGRRFRTTDGGLTWAPAR